MSDAKKNASQLFDPQRLELARKLRSLRKNQLAELLEVSPAAVTQYETGRSRPGPAVLARMALALGVSVNFFSAGRPQNALDPTTTHFRSLRTTRQIERDAALARAELTWELARLVEHYVRLPAVELPDLALGSAADSAELLADATREAWSLGDGPIANVVRLLETHGVVITRLDIGLAKVDAFSRWFEGRPVVVLCADKRDAARSRFDAAHELAHLLVHHDIEPGEANAEREANAFASAFLMPPRRIRRELPSRADWPKLLRLKQTWGVSLAALLYRARALGVMNDATYRRAMMKMSKEGWRRNEPGEVGPPESPSLFEKSFELLDEQGITVDQLADALRLPIELLSEIATLGEARPMVLGST